MVDISLEEVKIVVIEKVSPREFFFHKAATLGKKFYDLTFVLSNGIRG